MSQFLNQLYSRVYTPDIVPLATAWFLLLRFQTSEGTFLAGEEYLIRFKLTNKVQAACKTKAEGLHFGKKSERAAIQATTETVKNDFIRDSQQYIQFLINGILQRTGLRTNLIKGLAAFDPSIMLKRPMDVALRHFDMLYSSFAVRSWVDNSNELLCQDQYIQMLDHLRAAYRANFEVTSVASDLIEFMMSLEFLHERSHLLYLFRLCCLCTTATSPNHPDFSFGSITTTGGQSRFTDLIMLCQSSMSNVTGSVAHCSSDSNLVEFSLLSASFGRSAFSSEYDPWKYTDTFGRSKIYNSLLASYQVAISAPQRSLFHLDPVDTSTVADQSAVKMPSSSKRRKMSRGESQSATSSVVGSPSKSSSKSWSVHMYLCTFKL